MAITALPSSPSGEISHNDARLKINELVDASNSAKTILQATFDLYAQTTALNTNQNYAYNITVSGVSVGNPVTVNMNSQLLSDVETAVSGVFLDAAAIADSTVRVLIRVTTYTNLNIGSGLIISVIK